MDWFLCASRRKSKQALRDYKKVLLQLETLEINVGDQCRKEFTGTGRQYPNTLFKIQRYTLSSHCFIPT